MNTQPVLAIVGPTASGKTAVSIEVARRLGGEVISMDSRQVYRGMDIGTAKATPEQRALVPHHGLDLVDPDQRFSAGRFARYARDTITSMRERGAIPLLVGGTGFFLRALTHPIFEEPPLDRERRAALSDFLAARDDATLRSWLRALDPEAASRLESWGGRQRILRTLEMPLLTGRTLGWWQANSPGAEPLVPLVFVLQLPREQLDAAIDRRVDAMIRDGLVNEVASLLAHGYDERSPGMNATGYIEVIPNLRGEISLEEATAKIRKNTRAYARRQMTWLRNQLPEGALWLDATAPRSALVDSITSAVEKVAGVGTPRKRLSVHVQRRGRDNYGET